MRDVNDPGPAVGAPSWLSRFGLAKDEKWMHDRSGEAEVCLCYGCSIDMRGRRESQDGVYMSMYNITMNQ